jgi:hypothetical protein
VSIHVTISDRDGLPAEAQIPVLSAVEACPEHVEGRGTRKARAPVRTFGTFAAVQDSRRTVNMVNIASGEIQQKPVPVRPAERRRPRLLFLAAPA